MNIKALSARVRPLLWATLSLCWSGSVGAGSLNLANNALEIQSGVEPNVLLLTDNSGSMDWGLMAPIYDGSGYGGTWKIGSYRYFYAHPDPGASTAEPAVNEWVRVAPDPVYLASKGMSDTEGLWRAWNSDYNRIYYNPEVTYTPWRGVNNSGTAYTNAATTAAPYDPYYPSRGTLDLTSTQTYYTQCDFGSCNSFSFSKSGASDVIEVSNFYPARYYTWTDSDEDGDVDASDGHVLYEIRSSGCSTGATCPSTFTRPVFNESTDTGRSDCGEDSDGDGQVSCTIAQELQNFANWFSYYRKRDLTVKASLSAVLEQVINSRVAYSTIHGTSANQAAITSMNESTSSGNKKALLDALYSTAPDQIGTPLKDALYKSGRYFECRASDIFGSGSDSSPGDAVCPVFDAANGGACQQNYTILMTDGFPYLDTAPTIGNVDADTSNDYDGGAYADGYSNTLGDIAMYYYKRDLHALPDLVPTTTSDVAGFRGSGSLGDTMHQHMGTYGVAFGVTGSLETSPTDVDDTSFTWPDPTTSTDAQVDDLRHAAYNGRGQFLSATNSVALTGALKDVFSEIEDSTGAASAVAFNTQNIESGSLVFRAFFNTKTNTGDLVAQKVNLNGTVDPAVQWSAAEKLDDKVATSTDSRMILTYYDDGTTSSEGRAFGWANLSAAQKAALNAPQPANVTLPDTVGEERLGYLRGQTEHEGPDEADGELRERPAVAGKLGDIVHSSPVFVGKPSFVGRNNPPYPQSAGETYAEYQYANRGRQQLVYVGANDGMLHAFDANTGEEVFAYVPNEAYDNLSQFTRPSYDANMHQFYVDGAPQANDVYMDGNWHTVVVGGMGAGGRGYYAIDATDPSAFGAVATAKDTVLWEFTSDDDPDQGYSFGDPVIAMSNAVDSSTGEQRWVAIWGNGYNSTGASGDSALFVAFLDGGTDGVWTSGTDYIKIATGYGKAESSDGSTPNGIGGVRAIDDNGDGTVDYVYAGDYQGNVFRFDLSGSAMTDWDDSTFRLFAAEYDRGATAKPQPITRAPVVIKHPDDDGYVVVVGTGSWMTASDATNADIQSLYGLWDKPGSSWSAITTSQLQEQTINNESTKVEGYTVRTLSDNAVGWTDKGPAHKRVLGWFMDFDAPPAAGGSSPEFPGERPVRNLQLRGGIAFVNTVLPRGASGDPCATPPGGFEMAFDPATGGKPNKIVFDLNTDGSFTSLDNVGGTADSFVAGVRFDDATPTDSSFIGDVRVSQTSDKKIRAIKTNTGSDLTVGRQSWKELSR